MSTVIVIIVEGHVILSKSIHKYIVSRVCILLVIDDNLSKLYYLFHVENSAYVRLKYTLSLPRDLTMHDVECS